MLLEAVGRLVCTALLYNPLNPFRPSHVVEESPQVLAGSKAKQVIPLMASMDKLAASTIPLSPYDPAPKDPWLALTVNPGRDGGYEFGPLSGSALYLLIQNKNYKRAAERILDIHEYNYDPHRDDDQFRSLVADKIFKPRCIPLVEAYIETIATSTRWGKEWWERHWDHLFGRALSKQECWPNWVSICALLWKSRHFSEDKGLSKLRRVVDDFVGRKGNSQLLAWALSVYKEQGMIDELNSPRVLCTRRYNSQGRWTGEGTSSMRYLFSVADEFDNQDILILFLQYGIEATGGGEFPKVLDGDAKIYCQSTKKEIRTLMKTFFLVKPRIIEYINNSIPISVSADAQMALGNDLCARKALALCPGLASEAITDEDGNTPLHCAVLARNPRLIQICLHANARLLEIKNKNGLTPFQLSYAKNLESSLWAILSFCYAVHQHIQYSESSKTGL